MNNTQHSGDVIGRGRCHSRTIAATFAFILGFAFFAYGAIPNFHEVDEGFFRGGQPEKEEIEALRTLGIRTVVSFRNEKKVIRWEKELVEKSGMTFVSIPLTWKKSPTNTEARHFLSLVSQPEKRPLFIHCREGRDRTGAMAALYRIAQQGRSVETAYAEAKHLGFREEALPLKRFILVKASAFAEHPSKASFDFPVAIGEVLFYAFEYLVILLGLAGALICLRNPGLAIQIQKKFYIWINWRIEPLSMRKELRNTKIMGGILLFLSFLLVIFLYLFSI